jgi:hypothetical protein
MASAGLGEALTGCGAGHAARAVLAGPVPIHQAILWNIPAHLISTPHNRSYISHTTCTRIAHMLYAACVVIMYSAYMCAQCVCVCVCAYMLLLFISHSIIPSHRPPPNAPNAELARSNKVLAPARAPLAALATARQGVQGA